MRKLLDEAFCEKLLAKNMIEPSILEQLQRQNSYATLREKFLMDGMLDFDGYMAILKLCKDPDLEDVPSSLELDQRFLAYVSDQKLVDEISILACKRQAEVTPFRMRELFLANCLITLESYRTILHTIYTGPKTSENAEQTLIDEAPIQQLNKPTLSFVKDDSSQTILDIGSLGQHSEEDTKQKEVDESEETLIDHDFAPHGHDFLNDDITLDVPGANSAETAEDDSNSKDDYPHAETRTYADILAEGIRSSKVILETSKMKKNQEVQIENKQPPEEIPSDIAITATIKRPKNAETASVKVAPIASDVTNVTPPTIEPTIPNTTSPKTRNEMPMSEELNAVMLDRLVQQVQSQVYLQTQQISRDVGKEISGYKSFYKIIAGMVIFFSMFLLAFTAFIEFQRFQDLRTLRDEKQQVNEKNEQLQNSLLSEKEKNIHLQIQFAELKGQKDTIAQSIEQKQNEAKLQVLEAEKRAENAKLFMEQIQAKAKSTENIYKTLSYLEVADICYDSGDISKAKANMEEANKILEILDKEGVYDETLAIRWSNFVIKTKYASLDTVAKLLKKLPDSWECLVQLGNIYYKSSPMQKEAVKRYWGKALELNPNLAKIKTQLTNLK